MYARNEIYARHGYIFNDAEIRAYFEKKPWYTGTVKSEDFSSGVFNDYEYKNVTFLKNTRMESVPATVQKVNRL